MNSIRILAGAWFWLWFKASIFGASSFTVATYNLESYLPTAQARRQAKPELSKGKIRESLRALSADVVALQEVGGEVALLELRQGLHSEGLDYPHWEVVGGYDTNLHVAVLSKFPLVARRSHARESFLLHGRRFQVTRGFAEVDVRVNDPFVFTLLTAHLKSRRPVATADEAEIREQEAMRLREIIDGRLAAEPAKPIIVAGDFNDTQDSATVKLIVGRGQTKLIDTRPAERNGDTLANPNPKFRPRTITWTHFYAKEDTYSRIDYLLISPTLARNWDRKGTYVLAVPDWGAASDHRPIVARFLME